MRKYQDLVSNVLELRRLLRRTQMSAGDALGLLIDHLRYFEEAEQREDDLRHAEYPRHVYGL